MDIEKMRGRWREKLERIRLGFMLPNLDIMNCWTSVMEVAIGGEVSDNLP